MADLGAGAERVLPPGEGRHASRSLRLRAGDRVVLFDGRGREAQAEVVRIEGTRVVVRAGEVREAGRSGLVIASAVPKGARLDWMIEKLTELGVSEFRPVRFRRSVVSIAANRRGRLERVSAAAAKQCGRADLLRIAGEISVDELAASLGSRTCLTSPEAAEPLGPGGADLVIIGPEGGLTADEEARLTAAGATGVRLGDRILRIETAAVAAAAIVGAR